MKASFSIATTPRCRGGHFIWIVPLTLDMFLIKQSFKPGGIKYHFLVFGLNLDLSPTSGEHFNYYANGYVYIIQMGISLSFNL